METESSPASDRRPLKVRPLLAAPVESRAIYLALALGFVGAIVGFIATRVDPHLALAGPGSFGLVAACGATIVAAVTSAVGYWRSQNSGGQEWRRELKPATAAVTVIAVVIANTALAFLATYVGFLVLSLGLVGLPVLGFFGAAMMAFTFGVCGYMVFRSVARTTTQRLTSLLMTFVVMGVLTAAVTTPDPFWWRVHFSQLGTFNDASSWIFNGTLVVGGLLVTTFAVYIWHDMSILASDGHLAERSSPRTVARRFVIMGVMLAGVGLVPVDVSFLVHTVSASGLAVVYLMLLIGGRRHLAGMPSTYFVASWIFLGAIAATVALFFARIFSVTALEIMVFALIFGWISVFIRFLGAVGDDEELPSQQAGAAATFPPDAGAGLLVVLTGLPGSGKTTVAQALAAQLGAVHVRVDVVETALDTSGAVSLREHPELGYRVAYALAADHLGAGRRVIADTVNPIAATREAWRGVGAEAGVRVLEVEVVCSDAKEHQRRVEERVADIPGHTEPTWDDVVAREYESLTIGPTAMRVDTANGAEAAAAQVLSALASPRVGQ